MSPNGLSGAHGYPTLIGSGLRYAAIEPCSGGGREYVLPGDAWPCNTKSAIKTFLQQVVDGYRLKATM